MENRTTPIIWLRRDKLRILVALQSALAGSLVSSVLIFALNNYVTSPDQKDFFLIGLASGAIGGLVFSGWFGRPGKGGLLFAVIASVLCPVLGGAVVGTFMAPGIGTLFGAFMPLWLFVTPLALLTWVICLCTIHVATFILRAPSERQRRKHCP